jgi:hypothetical protein
MATYKLKKTDRTNAGEKIYLITVSFEKNGKKHTDTSEVSFPEKNLKKLAQAYADESEATFA